MKQTGWRLWVKRAFDRAAAAAGLVVLSPVMAATAVAVRITLGSPVLYPQMRGGYRGQPFELFKFRTMKDAKDANGRPLPPSQMFLSDSQRITPLGKFLRDTSLDELPQLWNVLKGDVSLVGPRPFHAVYLGRYSKAQMKRHDVRPGITGWAQINGRNLLTWDEKFALDLWYVENWSLALDAKILAKTVLHVLRREGISGKDQATMTEFIGSARTAPSRVSTLN